MNLKKNVKIQFLENGSCQVAKVSMCGLDLIEVFYFKQGLKITKHLKREECFPLPNDFSTNEFEIQKFIKSMLLKFILFALLCESFLYYQTVNIGLFEFLKLLESDFLVKKLKNCCFIYPYKAHFE